MPVSLASTVRLFSIGFFLPVQGQGYGVQGGGE